MINPSNPSHCAEDSDLLRDFIEHKSKDLAPSRSCILSTKVFNGVIKGIKKLKNSLYF